LKLHFFDEPYLMDKTDKHSKAVSGLILRERASYAEFERDLASDRTKAALAYRRARGEVYTRIPPFGFERGAGSKLVPVPEEQRIIARMRRMRSQHLGYRAIADRLNEDGVPTKLPGGKWYPTAVSRVLAREVPASVPENRRNSE
jgi:DNA invertase Pin-like site-specific DNA recombinase